MDVLRAKRLIARLGRTGFHRQGEEPSLRRQIEYAILNHGGYSHRLDSTLGQHLLFPVGPKDPEAISFGGDIHFAVDYDGRSRPHAGVQFMLPEMVPRAGVEAMESARKIRDVQ